MGNCCSTFILYTMVATKLLISLCVISLGVQAAPQQPDEQGIVSNVVTALQPQIAAAVAAALAGLNGGGGSSGSVTTTTTVQQQTGGNNGGSAFGLGAGSGSVSGFGSSSGSNAGSFGTSSTSSGSRRSSSGSGFNSGSSNSGSGVSNTGGASGDAGMTARAEYAYEYKVADDFEQTYISHEESRDGDDVTGVYSYIDPNGDLITVTYQAGAMGYTQQLDRQVGQVQIRSKTDRSGSSTSGSTSTSGVSTSSSGAQAVVPPAPVAQFVVAAAPVAPASQVITEEVSQTVSSTSNSDLDESALIAQILAVLQPQISEAVNSVVSSTV